MAYPAIVLNVMIASPTDVEAERDIVRSEIYSWNAAHSMAQQVVLNAIGWETNAVPFLGGHPQTLLNNQLCDIADFAIVIFHARLGTATPNAVSGTAEEIEYLLAKKKRVLLYQSKKDFKQESFDNRQYEELKSYLGSIEHLGLRQEFHSDSELRTFLQRQISQTVHEYSAGMLQTQINSVQEDERTQELSSESKWILHYAAKADGIILFNDFAQGSTLAAGGVGSHVEDPRKVARIQLAIEQLEKKNLVKQKSDVVWQVSSPGFEHADALKDVENWDGLPPPF